VVNLETRNGWGEVETIEVGRLDRRVSGLTAGSSLPPASCPPPSPTGAVGYWLGEFVDDGHPGGGEANRLFVPPNRASQLGIVGPVDSGENDSSSLSVAT
jgi:hypothetical protein